MGAADAQLAITTETRQAPLVRALASGRVTGEAAPLQHVTTHLSHVFIGPHRAYKLSRARRHPFVDLSEPGQREAAARAELERNRALAPSLYEQVAPVTLAPGEGYALGGQGAIVDWALVMRTIPEGATLDAVAAAGRFTVDLAVTLADVVADLHAGLAPAAGAGPDYGRIIDELEQTAACGGVGPAEWGQSTLFRRLRRALGAVLPLIRQRARRGCVRAGHGDLHLQNICLFEGRVTPFDAIGFDLALATTDVLYDLAFLLMDLRARGLRRQANAVMNRYWDRCGEEEAALALLPFFMGLRAAVRMAVLSEAGRMSEANAYRRLGLRLLHTVRPRLVAVGGLSGVGKSEIARALAPRLPGPCGGRVLRTDVLRKAQARAAFDRRLGPANYTPAARGRVYAALAAAASGDLAARVSVVADATFQRKAARVAIAAAAGAHPFRGVWLEAPWPVRKARIMARRGDPSDITPALAARQRAPRSFDEAWRRVDAAGSRAVTLRLTADAAGLSGV